MATSSDPVARFADVAERYVAWVEGPRVEQAEDVRRGFALVLELLRAAIELPDVDPAGPGVERLTHEGWQRVHQSFGWLPVQYYWDAEPLVDGPQELMTGDLCDDLADIWRDLKPALELYRAGHVDCACWHWKFDFERHWGEHAANAVPILMSTMAPWGPA